MCSDITLYEEQWHITHNKVPTRKMHDIKAYNEMFPTKNLTKLKIPYS